MVCHQPSFFHLHMVDSSQPAPLNTCCHPTPTMRNSWLRTILYLIPMAPASSSGKCRQLNHVSVEEREKPTTKHRGCFYLFYDPLRNFKQGEKGTISSKAERL